MLRVLLITYGLMSIVTFIAYGIDKRAARRSMQRTRERTLHLLGLAGGWPGAIAAQQFLRHKRRKRRFMLITWMIVALHASAWIAWAWFHAAMS